MNIDVAIDNMIDRALLEKLQDDKATQSAKMDAGFGGPMENVERVQNYGLTSYPGPGAQMVYLCLGGSQEYPLIITADHPDLRKKIKEWETALWTKHGNYVHLKDDGSIEISSKESALTVSMNGSGKMTIKNQTGELISILSEALQAIADSVVATAMGPQPLSSKAMLTQLKTKLDSFKE